MDEVDEVTAQEAQRVWALSKGVRAEMCWQGRQEMRAVIEVEVLAGEASDVDVTELLGEEDLGSLLSE